MTQDTTIHPLCQKYLYEGSPTVSVLASTPYATTLDGPSTEFLLSLVSRNRQWAIVQLNGKTAVEVLTLLPAEFGHRERATIAAMLFKPIEGDKTRIEFVRTLVRLFPLRETRRLKATKRAAADHVFESYEAPTAAKRKTSAFYHSSGFISHPETAKPTKNGENRTLISQQRLDNNKDV
ncbi:hypothetical protein DM02DRAFT_660002 [Periconia macrospinosa]|uniref:Uncharacterized protein n=1 Tax=Periconia macrospinosa TaxID=97972 RepID=A0A2V1DDD8_9PLEO|nr:hypothetical protein DM02DRAFT_660002 [Periconia macrospinosa]